MTPQHVLFVPRRFKTVNNRHNFLSMEDRNGGFEISEYKPIYFFENRLEMHKIISSAFSIVDRIKT
jgi:hypothetical protein